MSSSIRGISIRDNNSLKASYDYATRLITPIFAPVTELSRLFPDSILFGSVILYVITQNLSYGVFAIFLFETSLSHKLISFMMEQTMGKQPKPTQEDSFKCRTGYRQPRASFERIFMNDTYPSISIFFMGSILTYLSLAISSYKETLDTMGTDWNSRYLFAIITGTLLLFAVMLGQYFTGCTNYMEAGIALFAGTFIGACLYAVNNAIFGTESMNFLGLPYLVNKDETNTGIYICGPSQISPPNSP